MRPRSGVSIAVHGLRRVENINVYIGTRMYNNNTRLRYWTVAYYCREMIPQTHCVGTKIFCFRITLCVSTVQWLNISAPLLYNIIIISFFWRLHMEYNTSIKVRIPFVFVFFLSFKTSIDSYLYTFNARSAFRYEKSAVFFFIIWTWCA